jgi:uncharacterized protein (TIGR03545 family)
MREALYWYEKAKPFLQRSRKKKDQEGPEVVKPVRAKGLDVRFREHRPLPDLLIKLAKVSLSLDIGDFSGEIQNITPDQNILGKPMTLALANEKLEGIESIQLDGTFDHIHPAKPTDTLAVKLRGYRAKDIPLSESEEWPITLTEGSVNFGGTASLSGESLKADLEASLSSARLTTNFQNQDVIAQALADTLSGISSFQAKVQIEGTLEEFDIAIQSDIDRLLKQAVEKPVHAQVTKLEAELKSEILSKVDGPLKEMMGGLGEFDDISGELTQRLNLGDETLTSAVPGGTSGGLPLKLPF